MIRARFEKLMRDAPTSGAVVRARVVQPARGWGVGGSLAGKITLAFITLLRPAPANADSITPRVRVLGRAQIDADVRRQEGRIEVDGTVSDETGVGASLIDVHLTIHGEAKGAAAPASLTAAAPATCGSKGHAALLTLEAADQLVAKSDERGHFCVRFFPLGTRMRVVLETGRTGWLEPARLELSRDISLASVALRFDPPPLEVPLDEAGVELRVLARTSDDGAERSAPGLPIELTNEEGIRLGQAVTDHAGVAQFSIAADRMGKLGFGELDARFAGNAWANPVRKAAAIMRTSRVQVTIPGASLALDGTPRLRPVQPDEGVGIDVSLTPTCVMHGCNGAHAVATGAVVATLEDQTVGAATLAGGRTRLTMTFAARAREDVEIRFRYLPDVPWLRAGDDSVLVVPVRPPSGFGKLASTVTALVLLLWFVASRIPALGGRTRAPAVPTEPVLPGIRVFEESAAQESCGPAWTGRIVDAHNRMPVAALVRVERPGFHDVAILAEGRSGADGSFTLACGTTLPGDEIVVESPLHATLRRSAPGYGRLEVALVSRRRDLVDRMVAWARSTGRARSGAAEPTPGDIRLTGEREAPFRPWVDAVEHAAYSGAVVDANVQSKVESLAPADAYPAAKGWSGTPRH